MENYNNNYNPQQGYPYQNNSQPQYPQVPQQQQYQQHQYGAQPDYNQQYGAQPNYNNQYNQFGQQPGYGRLPAGSKDKTTAGLLAIFLGVFGVHKFYLGYTTSAVIMLLVSLIGWIVFGLGPVVMAIIALVEGIIYLTKSDQEFDMTYVTGNKEWF